MNMKLNYQNKLIFRKLVNLSNLKLLRITFLILVWIEETRNKVFKILEVVILNLKVKNTSNQNQLHLINRFFNFQDLLY